MSNQTFEDKLFDKTVPLKESIDPDDWLTPKEVASIFGVKTRTINRWFELNQTFNNIKSYKTPGGHRRFYRPDVMKALENHENNQQDTP